MRPDIARELRYRQPGTARLGIDPDGGLVVSGEDVIAVNLDAVNRALVDEYAMLRRRGQLADNAPPPVPLEEDADGTLALGDRRYRLVRRDRRNPNVAIYEQCS